MKNSRINSRKKAIKDQNYENYWKCTLALTDFTGSQFIRTLEIIINHIDKYNLAEKTPDELMKNYEVGKKRLTFNQEVTHAKELENEVSRIFKNDSSDGVTTRKQINTFIKLGFIKPYLNGYPKSAKEYIKYNRTKAERIRLFSDTVYQYSSFNSSQTVDSRNNNAIKFLVNTLINLPEPRTLSYEDIRGMMLMDIENKKYATRKEIDQHKAYSEYTEFEKRKYNQIKHFISVLKSMDFLSVNQRKDNFEVFLLSDAKEYLVQYSDTKRDSYRFGLMKKAIYEESERFYNDKICWLTKKKEMGLVVSHIYASSDAILNFEIDAAYDPNNALLLSANIDKHFDTYRITFNDDGEPIFSEEAFPELVKEVEENYYTLDEFILNDERKKYLKIHNKKAKNKFEY